MRNRFSIQIKASFFLLTFSLNWMVGFACALGLDMGFNSNHHQDGLATEVHIHADGKKHIHKKAGHSHDNPGKGEKEDCCNDKVQKVASTDKSMPRAHVLLNPIFLTAFSYTYFNIQITYASQVSVSVKYFVRSYHPPIPDIRTVIQSFQI